MQARSISETASVMTESLGKSWRVIHSKLGHSVESLLIMDVTSTVGESLNIMSIPVVLGGRNKGMKGINTSMASQHSKVLSQGSQWLLAVRSCNAARTSEAIGSSEVSSELPHSPGILSGMSPLCLHRDSIERLSNPTVEYRENKCRWQTHKMSIFFLPDILLSSGISQSCVSHNVSNTGS